MAKRKIKVEWTEADTRKAMARMNWERGVAEMREGRRQRATTFTDRRKEADRKACRKATRSEWS